MFLGASESVRLQSRLRKLKSRITCEELLGRLGRPFFNWMESM